MNIYSYVCIMKVKRPLSASKLGSVARVLKTISHPLRLEVMLLLEVNEKMSVSEIMDSLEMDVEQSLLSHHLGKMRDRGILGAEKEGKYIRYFIEDRKVLQIFDCMENCNF